MRRWAWVRVVAALAALMLVAVACSSDSDSDDSGNGGGDTSDDVADPADVDFTAGLTGEPVKIGVIVEETGGALANPEIPDGAMGAQLLVNEAGGIQGRPVEILTCDTANDPNTAAECGRMMVDEGVVALSGVLSVHAAEFMPLMEENKIPSVAHIAAGVPGFTSPAAFPTIGGIVATAPSVAVGVVEQGATKVSTPRPDLAAGAAIPTFVTPALEAFGAEFGNDVPVPELAPDMATYVQASLDGGADGIAVFLSGQDATNFVITARQSQPDVALGTFSTDVQAFRDALGEDLAGIVTSGSTTCEFESDACEQYIDSMHAAGFEETTGNRLLAWSGVTITALLLEDAAEISSAALWDALEAQTALDVGLYPPLQWQTPADFGLPLPRIFNTCAIPTVYDSEGETTPLFDTLIDVFTGDPCDASGDAIELGGGGSGDGDDSGSSTTGASEE